MNINITARNVKIPQSVTDYANEKLSRCQKYFSNIIKIDVVLSKQKYLCAVEIIIKVSRQTLKINQEAADFRSAIDLAVDKIERQLTKQKEKMKERRRDAKTADSVKAYVPIEDVLVEFDTRQLKPAGMSVNDAKDRLEKHDYLFWIFVNKDNSKLSVMYRRADQTYGLIEIK
jgi:putative sigma-54 modulation protein